MSRSSKNHRARHGDSREEARESQYGLAIDWVFGYRAHQCRDNIHVASDGSLLYPVAALVVIQDVTERPKQRYYAQHTDDVLWFGLTFCFPLLYINRNAPKGKSGTLLCLISTVDHNYRNVQASKALDKLTWSKHLFSSPCA